MILFNKPYQVLSCFTDPEGRSTLSDYIHCPNVYAAGRLDYDSEGLLLLTDDGALQHRLSNPRFKLEKTYWVQVEGCPTDDALNKLRAGILLKDGMTRPARVNSMIEPRFPERHPPIRTRPNSPTQWLEIKITEGRNRQVRRMTAAIGFPTLRLIRYAIGQWTLDNIAPGESRVEQVFLPTSPKNKAPRKSTALSRRKNAAKPAKLSQK